MGVVMLTSESSLSFMETLQRSKDTSLSGTDWSAVDSELSLGVRVTPMCDRIPFFGHIPRWSAMSMRIVSTE